MKKQWLIALTGVLLAVTMLSCTCCVSGVVIYRYAMDPTPTVKAMIEQQEGVKIKSIILKRQGSGWVGAASTKNGQVFTITEVYTDNWNTFAKWKRE